jgi:hypothetical protein
MNLECILYLVVGSLSRPPTLLSTLVPMQIENTPFYSSIRIIMHDASSQAVTWLGRGHEEEAVENSH